MQAWHVEFEFKSGGKDLSIKVDWKASLNVGVAFGILMQKWVESLENN